MDAEKVKKVSFLILVSCLYFVFSSILFISIENLDITNVLMRLLESMLSERWAQS